MKYKGVIVSCILFFVVSCNSADLMRIDSTNLGGITTADPEKLTADSIQLTYAERTGDNSIMMFHPKLQAKNLALFGWMDKDTKFVKRVSKESYYVVKYSQYNKSAMKLLYEIISYASFNHVRYILYGKDRLGRNTGYIYEVGRRSKGLVFFYPDNWDCINNGWENEKYNCYGFNIRIKNFICLMLQYNPHIYALVDMKDDGNIFYKFMYR